MKYHEKDFAYLLGLYRERAGFTQQELAYKISVHRNTLASWEARGTLPKSRGQVLRLADELMLSQEERKSLIQAAGLSVERWPTEVWTVPQQRDMFFTGRDDVFQSLRQLLVPGSMAALTQAISGLGGIGKTHTAVEYAYRFHQYYEAVLWLPADSWEVLVSSCMKLTNELGLPEQKETDLVIVEVQHWLGKHREWLLILDNVENPQEILPKFVPTHHHGCVLITTRVYDVEPLAQTWVLETMPEPEGILFLLRRTKKIGPKAGLEQATTEQYQEAKQIWQLMSGLPLALDQAGTYILETHCSLSAYREQYTHRRGELLNRRGNRFIGHEASVATTFSLAFEQIQQKNQAAIELLKFCAYLAPDSIPLELITQGAVHLGAVLEIVAADALQLDQALETLQSYSLLRRDAESRTLSLHRLVQAVLQSTMPEPDQVMWMERALAALNTVFPRSEPTTWSQCDRLVLHVQVCATHTQPWRSVNTDQASLFFKTAKYLADRAQYLEAEPLYQRALHIREQALGPVHPDVATVLNNLAELYREQGKYAEAELLYQRALRIQEQAQGPDHPDVAYPLNNLAELYDEQGKYTEVEPLLQRALHIWEQALGLDHPKVATSLNNLAVFYEELGKYVEAEPLYQRALRIREQAQGPDHPDVATPLHNLATLYRKQDKYVEAEPLYQRALRIREQALGPDHLRVAYPLEGLANLYHNQGRYTEAEPLYQRVLYIREQALGPTHPDVAYSFNNFALLYKNQGKNAEAELLYQRALHIWEQTLGPDHSNLVYPLNNLATLYYEQGKYVEAEPLYQRALRIQEQAQGPDHPDVAMPLHNLAELYRKQGRYTEAETLYQRTLHILEQALGPKHSNVAYPLNGLANLYREQGKHAEAESFYRQAIATLEHNLGPQHLRTADVVYDFAEFQYVQGNKQEAESLYQRALTIREQILGQHQLKTMETRQRYITLLREMGRQDEVALLDEPQPEQGKTEEERNMY